MIGVIRLAAVCSAAALFAVGPPALAQTTDNPSTSGSGMAGTNASPGNSTNNTGTSLPGATRNGGSDLGTNGTLNSRTGLMNGAPGSVSTGSGMGTATGAGGGKAGPGAGTSTGGPGTETGTGTSGGNTSPGSAGGPP